MITVLARVMKFLRKIFLIYLILHLVITSVKTDIYGPNYDYTYSYGYDNYDYEIENEEETVVDSEVIEELILDIIEGQISSNVVFITGESTTGAINNILTNNKDVNSTFTSVIYQYDHIKKEMLPKQTKKSSKPTTCKVTNPQNENGNYVTIVNGVNRIELKDDQDLLFIITRVFRLARNETNIFLLK